MSAIQLCDEFRNEVDQYSMELQMAKSKPDLPKPSAHFLGRTIFDHILLQLKSIRSSDLENSLKFLNQSMSFSLMFYIEHLLRNNIDVELCTRVALYIIQRFRVQIELQNDSENLEGYKMHEMLYSVDKHMKAHFKYLKDTIGVNVQGIKMLKTQMKNN